MSTVTAVVAIIAGWSVALYGQQFTDPGFETYAVNPGGFLQPTSGSWLFSNDGGVVEPPAPNSSTGPLNTWSATFAPVEGQQYASTYAAGDTIRQSVAFNAAGDYRISVFAVAPTGTVTIPSVGTFALGDGEFTLTLGGAAIGSLHTVPAGANWSLFSADFNIATPGNYQLGVRNTVPSPYFINYDAFALQPVPEPSTIALGLLGALGAVICWKRIPR